MILFYLYFFIIVKPPYAPGPLGIHSSNAASPGYRVAPAANITLAKTNRG